MPLPRQETYAEMEACRQRYEALIATERRIQAYTREQAYLRMCQVIEAENRRLAQLDRWDRLRHLERDAIAVHSTGYGYAGLPAMSS